MRSPPVPWGNAASAPAPSWRIRLLGGFRAARGDDPVRLAPTAQRLVAFLAMHGPTGRAQTAWTLWESKSDGRALADLRTTLWRLDRTAPGLLDRLDGVLELAPQVDVDARRFAAGGSVDESFLSEHVARGCPHLLPGWQHDWVLIGRERIRHRFVRALEETSGAALRTADPATALRWASAAVSVDCLRESAHRLVLAALLADGRITEARRHADTVTRLLADQLSVQPSAQLAALIRECRARPAG